MTAEAFETLFTMSMRILGAVTITMIMIGLTKK